VPKKAATTGAPPKPKTETQVSSGGVVYRRDGTQVDVILILVGEKRRWQLPKGIVEPGETPETTAVREAREEAGVDTRLGEKIDTVEYWYVSTWAETPVRYHKFVHFFLLEYTGGDVAQHDQEVIEARWMPIGESVRMLSFANEKKIVERAAETLRSADLTLGLDDGGPGAIV
jgi:8-oxo-dGTP diphosphatase